MKKIANITVLSLLLIFGLSSFQSAENPILEWERIGSKKVNFKVDRDVINVELKDGRFSKLKLVVTGGDLNMHRMVVYYGNGKPDDIALRHNFSQGSTSRVIDLNGKERFIKKIVFVYDTKNNAKRKAKLHVFGKR